MATRRYRVSPGGTSVTEEVGAATSAEPVELTVDLGTTIVNDNGSTRTINQDEVLEALERIKLKVTQDNWPPA